MAQGRRTPATTHTVLAVSDVRRSILERFMSDGELCDGEQQTLLLLDTAAYHAGSADLNRRKRENLESHGEILPGLARDIAQHEQAFAHVIETHAA